jgi:hypothetical protein
MRRTILGMVVACAVLAIPASANAAQVNAVGTQINVRDDSSSEEPVSDNITLTKFNAWEFHIVNDGGNPAQPLTLTGDTSPNLSCLQDSPRKVICIQFTGGPPITTDIFAGEGNDTVTVGPHPVTETVQVRGDFGIDVLNIENGSVDRYSCGANDPEGGGGSDTVVRDAADTLWNPAFPTDCENDNNPGGGGSGGGGSGGGGSGAGDGSGAGGGSGAGAGTGGGSTTLPVVTPITQPASMVLGPVAGPHRGRLLVAARVNGPGVVTGKATKGTKLLAKGSKTATKAGAVTLTLKPTKAAKRLLKSKPSVKVKVKLAFKPTTGATVVKTISARLRR